MPRPQRSVAGLCIAVIVLAALLPGISAFVSAIVDPQWVLLPEPAPIGVDITPVRCDEQLVSLFALLPSRAPPSTPLA